jgi:hypothetical protein
MLKRKKSHHPTRKQTKMKTVNKTNFTADKHNTAQEKKEGQPVQHLGKKSGFSAYINISPSNKFFGSLTFCASKFSSSTSCKTLYFMQDNTNKQLVNINNNGTI